MKYISNLFSIKTVYLTIVLALATSSLIAQNGGYDYKFTDVQIGSKVYYNIKMQSNVVHKARVVSVDPVKVLLLLPGGETITVPTNEVVQVKEQSYNSYGSIGLGFGIPYGMFGANLDIKMVNVFYATAGIGTGIYVTPMYNVGLKCFLLSGNYKFRPRVMVNYGTTSMINIQDSYGNTIEKGTFNGISLAAGFQWGLNITKTVGFDVDIIYIVDDSEMEERVDYYKSQGYKLDFESTGNVKVSLGIRYIF